MPKYILNLRLFDTQTTETPGLSDEMKTYYDDYMIDNAVPNLIHDQFGQERPIPKGKGKTVEYRKYAPLAKATTPLVEGVTPSGNSLNVSTVTATVKQYGDFIELSDVLILTAIDNNLVEATVLLGDQAGQTLDTIVREIINAGTNVQYGANAVLARYLLTGGVGDTTDNYLNVKTVKYGARNLKNNLAKKINGNYAAIIHPDVAFDLTEDDRWLDPHTYQDTSNIYEGEIGKIEGVRFVETTEAKIFHAEDLSESARNLTVASYATKVITISETLTSADQTALIGRSIIVDGYKYTIASATSDTITISESPTHDPAGSDVVYPGEAGAAGRDVYSTLIIGANAYGTTKVTGGGLQTIVKQLGSAGTSDPLNQRATVGWKAIKTAVILVNEYMVRVETTSEFESGSN
jgi:N4-gp56 family major capsid protein